MSSLGRITTRAVRPWRSALRLERTLPFGEAGPVDFIELSRLAAYCAGVGIIDNLRFGYSRWGRGTRVKVLILLVKIVVTEGQGFRTRSARRATLTRVQVKGGWKHMPTNVSLILKSLAVATLLAQAVAAQKAAVPPVTPPRGPF